MAVGSSLNDYVVKIVDDHCLVLDGKSFHQIVAISRN
jgi:hypothetical protein